MKRLRWQLIIIFVAGLVVGGLLLIEQPPAQQVVKPTPVPEQGGVYTEALVGSMQRLNPLLDSNNPADRDVDRLLFSRLLRFDDRGIPQPDLAKSWGVSADGTVYNFTLYENAKWHDGTALTTEDVVFTVELLRNGGTIVSKDLQAFWKEVQVEALNETTISFLLPEAFAPFTDYLTFGVLPKHRFEGQSIDQIASSRLNLQPVGSGPYKFDKLIIEGGEIKGIQLSAFEAYYAKKPFIEQMVLRYYPDSAAALKAYQDDKVQGISQVSADILPAVLASPDLGVYTGRKPELTMILFNHKDPQAVFLKDAAVRRALLLGLNRTRLINQVMNGQAILAHGPIFPEIWAYYDGIEKFDYDLTAADKALKDVGYPAPTEKGAARKKGDSVLSFELLYPSEPLFKSLAELVKKDWEALGVQVSLVGVPYTQLVNERLEQRNYQAALVSLNFSRTPDPDPYPFWDQAQSVGGQNYTQWDNRMASEFLEQARILVDRSERVRYYRNFQVLFTQEMPALPLFYPVYTYAVDKQVQGVRMGPLFESSDRFATVTEWFLETKKASPAIVAPTATK